jgi:phosphate transport system substrate-binding protein
MRFTVATEDYVLSRRLFLYTPAAPQNALVSWFIDFALSEEGQEIVHRIGFVKQSIDSQRPVRPANASRDYLAATNQAERLSLNFRFRSGKSELDSKALRDVNRLSTFFSDSRLRDRKLVLLGLADGKGAAAANLKLSRDRARIVAEHLVARGLSPNFVTGVGSELPIASNDTEQGRERNRRVEVWLRIGKEAGAN